jgi:hypothetical protein
MTATRVTASKAVALSLTLAMALAAAGVLGSCSSDPGGYGEYVEGDLDGDGIADYPGYDNYEPSQVPDLS